MSLRLVYKSLIWCRRCQPILQVNYKLLPETHRREKSAGARSIHNSFYIVESHSEPFLTDNHGIFVDDFFGFRFTDKIEKELEYEDN